MVHYLVERTLNITLTILFHFSHNVHTTNNCFPYAADKIEAEKR